MSLSPLAYRLAWCGRGLAPNDIHLSNRIQRLTDDLVPSSIRAGLRGARAGFLRARRQSFPPALTSRPTDRKVTAGGLRDNVPGIPRNSCRPPLRDRREGAPDAGCARRLRDLGFAYVALDLEGYHMGSLNEVHSGGAASGTKGEGGK